MVRQGCCPRSLGGWDSTMGRIASWALCLEDVTSCAQQWEVLQARAPRLPRSLFGFPCRWGWRLYSVVREDCWLGSLTEKNFRMGSTAVQGLWSGLLVR